LKNIRKLAVTIIAGILLIFGILMIILPGPALIIIPLALVILNTYHPEKVRSYARKFRYMMRYKLARIIKSSSMA